VLDFNEKNQVVEILGVKDRVPLADLKRIQFEVAVILKTGRENGRLLRGRGHLGGH
jgi:hypothetical protein